MTSLQKSIWLGVAAALILGITHIPALAQPTVQLKPTQGDPPMTFPVGSTETKQMGIYISDIPAPGWLGAVSFHLVWDKTKLNFDNFALTTGALQNLNVGQVADGVVLSAGRFGGTGTIDPNNPVITFDVSLANGTPAGTYPVNFDVEDEVNNFLWDSEFVPIPNVNWNGTNVEVTAGPPNPANITGWEFAARQKSPVQFTIRFGPGNVTRVDVQYRVDTQWENITAGGGNTITIGNRRVEVTWNAPFPNQTRTVHLRARLWDRDENSGFNEAPDALIVDNQPPNLTQATGAGNKVTLQFQANEQLQAASANNENNYTVQDQGPIPQNGTIPVTDARKVGANVVELTLGQQLAAGRRYKVTATNIADTVGNIMETDSATFDVLAKPTVVAARFLRDGTNRRVEVEFSKQMKSQAPLTDADAWVVQRLSGATSAQAGTVPVQSVSVVPSNKKLVRLTLAEQLQPASQYRVTAPPGSKDVDDEELAEGENTATFQTPLWHLFEAGLRMLGIPLSDTGRLIDILDADAVAWWDPNMLPNGGYVIDRGAETSQGVEAPIQVEAGRGYFARFENDTVVYFDGEPLRGNIVVALGAGWNLITNPYVNARGNDIPIDISQLSFGPNGQPIPFAWHWDGHEWQLVLNAQNSLGAGRKLNAWKGYFIRTDQAGDLTIAAQTTQAAPAMSLGDKPMLVRLVARAGNSADATNVCGVSSAAVQVPNPPTGIAPVDLYFVNPDGSEPLAMDIRAGSPTQSWDLVVTTSLPNARVVVSAPDLSAVPPDYAVILTDKDTGKKTYLRTSAGYVFTSGPQGATHRLVLEIVPRSTASLLSGVSVQQAAGGSMVVTYQLSGPASVSAKVLNIAGRLVRQLVSSRAETAGTHTLTWNLTNSAGSPVPRGMYVIVLEARTEDGQQTRAVQPFSVNR